MSKLNSFLKIEKQARRYAEENPPAPVDSEEQALAQLLPEHRRLTNQWAKLRDAFCSGYTKGGRCICSAHPRYKELVIDGIQPLTAKINAIQQAKGERHRAVFAEQHGRLLRARLAKEKWLAQEAV